MKKFLFTIAAIAFGMSQASAQTISFGPLNDEGFIEVPQGGQATVAAQYTKESTTIVKGYKFTLTFQDKYVNTVKDKNNLPVFNLDSDNDAFAVQRTENNGFSAIPAASSASLKGTEGSFGTLIFEATADAEIGSTHLVKVSNAGFTIDVDGALKTQLVEDFTFTVKIVDNRITLDETVGVTDETPTGEQNVLVKRTIKAGNWSTICLPFDVDASQAKEAFGDDVQLAEFTGCTGTYASETDNFAQSIKVNFSSVTSLSKNTPYLIKVSEDVKEFSLDGVNVEPAAEEDLLVAKDMVKVSRTVITYNYFIGTYVPGTTIPKGDLYLSGNKFYFSKGGSSLKAFRGYFEFETDMIDVQSELGAKITVNVDGEETTAIDGMDFQRVVEGVYDLSGRKIQLENGDLNKLQKGVYIIDGKKVTIK